MLHTFFYSLPIPSGSSQNFLTPTMNNVTKIDTGRRMVDLFIFLTLKLFYNHGNKILKSS